MPEPIMTKTSTFINGYSGELLLHSLISYIHVASLKKETTKCRVGSDIPSRAGLKTIYTALLISTMEQPFSSVKALSKYVLIPAESGILMLLGYIC